MILSDDPPVPVEDLRVRNTKIDAEIQTLEASLVQARDSGTSLTDAIDFAFSLIKNLPNEWQALDVVDFKALRNLIFPKNVTYYYPGFQTPEPSFIYIMNQMFDGEKETVVAPRGIASGVAANVHRTFADRSTSSL